MRFKFRPRLPAILGVATAAAVSVNALWLQQARHPAPLFAPDARPPVETAASPQAGPAATLTRQQAAARMQALQRALGELGFYDGPIDGIDGPRTRMAVAAYQRAHGLESTGRADERLFAHVRTAGRPAPPVPPPLPASPERRVRALQQALADLGYAPGRIDGRLHPRTRAAIARFERDHGLAETGRASEALMRKLSAVAGVALDAANRP